MSVDALELRDAEAARRWLSAGICTMRLGHPTAELIAETTPWIAGVLSEQGVLPPVGVLADLGRSLLAGSALPAQGLEIDDQKLRGVVRVYESDLLGRFHGESRLQAAADAIARLPVELRTEAVSVFLSMLLNRLGFSRGIALQSGAVRRLSSLAAGAIIDEGLEAISQPGPALEALSEGYARLVRASRHVGQLVTEADVFVLEHLGVLRTSAQRLEVAQIAEVAAQLSRTLPKRMRRQVKPGSRPTSVEDDAQYPVGGFTSIETSGAIENLVTSELVYMDDESTREAGEPDLFEVRYVEGELLYYTRDESVLVREQRVFTFVLPPELVQARFKDRDSQWQRLVIVLGAVLCLVQRLTEWLNEAGLLFRVVLLHDPQTKGTPLGPEKSLCELLLHEWIEKGVAVVEELSSWETLFEQAALAARTAQSDVLAYTAGAMPKCELDSRVRTLAVDVSQALPIIRSRIGEEPRSADSSWAAWTDAIGVVARWLC